VTPLNPYGPLTVRPEQCETRSSLWPVVEPGKTTTSMTADVSRGTWADRFRGAAAMSVDAATVSGNYSPRLVPRLKEKHDEGIGRGADGRTHQSGTAGQFRPTERVYCR
jgi:hypothetical protein